MRIENSFEVPAPPAEAWKLLNDVPRVLPCMPGAELDEIVDDNTYKVTMHVKLGPVALKFKTDVTRAEADDADRRVTLNAKAQELKGRGTAQAVISSQLAEANGGTRVSITTDLTLQGTIAQFGRGIVGDVAQQLTNRFAEGLAAQLETGPPESGAPTAAPPTTTPPPPPVQSVGGLRLGLAALWRAALRSLRPGTKADR
jgi:carbon monoxide dehydrogenase subunit G